MSNIPVVEFRVHIASSIVNDIPIIFLLQYHVGRA